MRRVVVATLAVTLVILGLLPTGAASAGKKAHLGKTKLTVEPGEFPYGVGANDVSATRANLWTQTTGTRLRAMWSTDPSFASGTVQTVVTVDPSHDGTVLVRISGLSSGTTYYYKFVDRSSLEESRIGTFTTAPDPSTPADVTFTYSGDQDGTIDTDTGNPCSGGAGSVDLTTFTTIQNESSDFYVNLGDTIYSDSSCLPAPDMTVDEYRNSYKQNFSFDSFRNLRASTGFYTQWDDHEVRNDWDSQTVDPTLLANGTQAFTEYDAMQPPSPTLGFYRHFRWGSKVEVFVLDERSFRTTEADRRDTDNNAIPDCQNSVTLQSDLAPTLSQSWRDFFAAQIPGSGLDQPVPAQCTADLNDPNSSILGVAQRTQFLKDLKRSTATFKLVMNEDPIQQFFALPYDRWEGFRSDRNLVLSYIDQHDINNVVWLTTDIHAYFGHTVDYNTDTPGSTGGVQGMIDYTTGPIATFTFRSEINSTVGDDTASSVRAFLININQNFCTMLGGDGNPTAPWYGYSVVHVDAATDTISVIPKDYTNTKIAANGVHNSGRDDFCYDYIATAQ